MVTAAVGKSGTAYIQDLAANNDNPTSLHAVINASAARMVDAKAVASLH